MLSSKLNVAQPFQAISIISISVNGLSNKKAVTTTLSIAITASLMNTTSSIKSNGIERLGTNMAKVPNQSFMLSMYQYQFGCAMLKSRPKPIHTETTDIPMNRASKKTPTNAEYRRCSVVNTQPSFVT